MYNFKHIMGYKLNYGGNLMKEFLKKRFVMLLISLILVVLLFFTLGTIMKNNKKSLTMNEKIEDFEYMYNVIKEGFPYLEVNHRMNNINWLKSKDKYLKDIKNTTDDEEYKQVIESALKDLNNGNTYLINTKKEFDYFKNIYEEKGWYDFWNESKVNDRYESSTDLISDIGQRLFETSHVITEDVVEGKVGYLYLPKMKVEGEETKKELENISEYLAKIHNYNSLIIDIRGNSGGSDTYWESIVSMLLHEDEKKQGYILFRQGPVLETYLKARGINTLPIVDIPEEVLAKSPIEVLNSFSGYIMQDKVIKANPVTNFHGKIYLLVDSKVYSSAESFALFCKKNNFATLIGEVTGGDGGGIPPMLFNLPNSGFLVRMAADMYLTSDGECNEEFKTVPHIIINKCGRTSNLQEDLCIKKAIELGNSK